MIIGVLFLLAAITAFIQSLFEQEPSIFIGVISNDFELAGNWSTRIVPSENDSVVLLQNSPHLSINKDVTVKNFNTVGFQGVITLNASIKATGKFNFYTGRTTYTTTRIKENGATENAFIFGQ